MRPAEVEVDLDPGKGPGSPEAGNGQRKSCVAHCPSCGSCFSSDGAFFAHRTGPHGKRRCSFGSKRLAVKTEDGSCRLGWPGEVRRVVLWQTPPTGFTGGTA
jgi:hypothetical protein